MQLALKWTCVEVMMRGRSLDLVPGFSITGGGTYPAGIATKNNCGPFSHK
ncbi:hypothetical protein ACPOL_5098 [Acidisarcina polymorpha]|uniref:Uncharacterized protein n=1 Tax=Acidisarcina polymorpha TaxID=2211140 RepID=A0A2Z5G6Q4_9BACT|nr:hypothetical protein ACPOL_5098 [Acidisarcina polymorpha]